MLLEMGTYKAIACCEMDDCVDGFKGWRGKYPPQPQPRQTRQGPSALLGIWKTAILLGSGPELGERGAEILLMDNYRYGDQGGCDGGEGDEGDNGENYQEENADGN